MFVFDVFQKYAARAREERALDAFARAARPLNEAEDPLAPEDSEAFKVVAALEALYLVLPREEPEATFRQVLDALTGKELDEEPVDDLLDGFFEGLEDEGLDQRIKAVTEALRDDPLAEQTFRLCLAIWRAANVPDDENDLLVDLAEELGVSEPRLDQLRAEVDAVLS